MLTKPYGNTGKQVSAVSFGGMRFSEPVDIEKASELVLYAHSKGINYFDTAPSYCQSMSEKVMEKALSQVPRDSYFISTKCAARKSSDLRKSLENSLELLKVDQIDFFHIWWVCSLEEWGLRVSEGAVAELLKAKEQGLVKHVVISSHLPGMDIAKVLEQAPFEGVTVGYNALNFPYRQAALDYASEKNLGVITMNPLAGGIIPQHADRFDFLKQSPSDTVVKSALRFIISQPSVTSALVGFNNKKEIDEAVSVVENFKPYSQDDIKAIEANILESFDDLCTGCGYCLPCPARIEIPKFMDAYNYEILLGNADQQIRDRLQWHWQQNAQTAGTCINCGFCEQRCTQHLSIRDRLHHIAELAEPGEN